MVEFSFGFGSSRGVASVTSFFMMSFFTSEGSANSGSVLP